MLQMLSSFVISLFIGLLIGIEREHSHHEDVEPIGVRTFILFSFIWRIIWDGSDRIIRRICF